MPGEELGQRTVRVGELVILLLVGSRGLRMEIVYLRSVDVSDTRSMLHDVFVEASEIVVDTVEKSVWAR
jgi:hypothetical protein